jgi:TonB family protein
MIARTIFLFLTITSTWSFAQELSKECFTGFGKLTSEDQSEYCVVGKHVRRLEQRLVNETIVTDTVDSFIDTVKAYYVKSKSPKFFKIYDKQGYAEGDFVEYYANGKIKESSKYRHGRRVGKIFYFHPTGEKKSIIEPYDNVGPGVFSGVTDLKIMDYWDSLGNQLVTKGNGHCNCYLQSGRREVGKVVNGLRDSVWNEYSGDTLILTEHYDYGLFVEGVRYHEGETYYYKSYEAQPEYPGGFQAMMKHIAKNMRYPASARKQRLYGTVYVSFVVRKDGAITDVKLLRGFQADCDKESVRVVKLMEKWIPGLQRGCPVNVRFNLPIKFNLF